MRRPLAPKAPQPLRTSAARAAHAARADVDMAIDIEVDNSDDPTGDFGGLADVLEPVDGVGLPNHLPAASPRAYVQSARMSASAPASLRSLGVSRLSAPAAPASAPVVDEIDPSLLLQPVQVQDFAFADTVFARELESEIAPPSGPIFVNDPNGNTQCVTPLAFPLPDAASDAAVQTRMRIGISHARHGIRRSIEELQELWSATTEIVAGDHEAKLASGSFIAPPSGLSVFVRRLLALWSCFQWDRADLARAVIIGCAVFIVAAAAGASALDARSDRNAAAAADSEVREAHTLDQHTAHRVFVRAKASR